jgi:zinc protease
MIIVGDTTLSEITPKLENFFAGWKAGKVPEKNVSSVQPSQKSRVYLIDKPGAQQSTIFVGLVAPPKSAPGNLAIEAMNDVLGGNFSSRLNMNLREDKHYSYGASAILLGSGAQRPYLSFSPVQTDKTKESIVEINKEYQNITGGTPVTPAELALAKSNSTLSLPGSRETLQQVGQSIDDLIHYGLPDDYYATYATRVNALTAGDLNDAAKSVIKPNALTWVIVGDRAKIEAGVRELNLGDFQLIDADGNSVK